MKWRRFRKKPVIIEATQWFSLEDLPDIVHPYKKEGICKNCGGELKEISWLGRNSGRRTYSLSR